MWARHSGHVSVQTPSGGGYIEVHLPSSPVGWWAALTSFPVPLCGWTYTVVLEAVCDWGDSGVPLGVGSLGF